MATVCGTNYEFSVKNPSSDEFVYRATRVRLHVYVCASESMLKVQRA